MKLLLTLLALITGFSGAEAARVESRPVTASVGAALLLAEAAVQAKAAVMGQRPMASLPGPSALKDCEEPAAVLALANAFPRNRDERAIE